MGEVDEIVVNEEQPPITIENTRNRNSIFLPLDKYLPSIINFPDERRNNKHETGKGWGRSVRIESIWNVYDTPYSLGYMFSVFIFSSWALLFE